MLTPRMRGRVEVMRRVVVLASLGERSLEDLARASVRRELARRQVLVREGERFDALGLVLAGRLDVSTRFEGRERILRALRAGDAVGFSLVAGAAATATLSAGERDTAVLLVPGRDVRAAWRSHPDASLAAILALARIVGVLTDELAEACSLPLEQRVVRLVRRLARGQREVLASQAELAAALGASRERVNQALARLARRGVVRVGRRRVILSEAL